MNYGDKKAKEITEAIIKALEAGKGNGKWSMPWAKIGSGHRNAFTKRPYRGFNAIWLAFVAMKQNYTSTHWATFNAWKKAGHKIAKGSKSTSICFWQANQYTKTLEDGSEETRKGFIFKVYNVFNADCVEGWDEPSNDLEAVSILDHCEETIANTGAIINHGGDRAFYAPSLDSIQLPTLEQFDTTEDYYATAFHELIHWTGAEHRLNREFGKRFGDNAYAFEELVAELGAVMVCAEHGIEAVQRDSHVKYIQSWIDELRADPKVLWTAGTKAQAAADYILQAEENEQAKAA